MDPIDFKCSYCDSVFKVDQSCTISLVFNTWAVYHNAVDYKSFYIGCNVDNGVIVQKWILNDLKVIDLNFREF